ncbi:MAG: hypothetical protein JO210_15290, partial [Acidobacteriaceae bacterium]|nr:hypothetical protein [Acidobacteriaceae bacterium]
MTRNVWIVCVGLICALLSPARGTAASAHTERVLVLYSLSPDTTVPGPFDELVRPALEKKLSHRIEAFTEYLESQRFPEEAHQRKLSESLGSRYRSSEIDVIMPVGFTALQFARRYIADIWRSTPIIFVSVESRKIKGFVLPPHTTGVLHTDDWQHALGEILRIHPDAREVLVVGGSAPIDHEYLEVQKRSFQPFVSKVKFRYLTDLPLPDMLRIVSALAPETVVIQSSFNWDSHG